MTPMKRATAIVCMTAFLGGCITMSDDNLARVEKYCNLGTEAYAAFLIIAATGNIKPSIKRKADGAYQALHTLCLDPATADIGDVLVAAATAYATIIEAKRQAGG